MRTLYPFLLLLAAFPAISFARDAGKPLVVASIKPLALIARDIAGDWLEVESLLGPGQEPHHVALSISQRKMLAEADLVLWTGPGLETFLAKPLGQLESKKILGFQDTLSQSAVKIYPHDAHYWLHPELVAGFYRAVAQKLAHSYPDKAEVIHTRLQASLAELAALSTSLAAQLEPLRAGSIVVDHQAYTYFADYFHLHIAGAMVDESGVPVGPRTLAGLVGQTNIRCLVVEQLPAPGRARKMAASLGVELVAIDALGINVSDAEGYAGLLTAVAGGFVQCLGRGQN